MGDFPQRFGKYVLVDRMAMGGMAELFLAVERSDVGGYRFVTIKRIRPDFDHDEEFIQFFRLEGKVLLMCAHPNLAQGYDMGQVGGCHYLALEYIHGCTLLDLVRAAALGRKPLSVSTVVQIGIGVAAGLEHAHGLRAVDGSPLGVVHRDVTPQNVMIAESGTVKLIDFGIVRAALQTHRTQHGVVKGKFAYMAPEALDGKGNLDQRADLFALGIVLHESLTGRALFRGTTDHDTLDRIRHMEIPDLRRLRPDLPDAVAEVFHRALCRNPAERFQSAGQMLRALETAAESCHIHLSMTKLRDEVVARCGFPDPPILSEDQRAILDVDPTPPSSVIPEADERRFDTVLMDGPPDMESSPSGRSGPVTDPGHNRPSGLERDPQLMYFLRKAGSLPASSDGQSDG